MDQWQHYLTLESYKKNLKKVSLLIKIAFEFYDGLDNMYLQFLSELPSSWLFTL